MNKREIVTMLVEPHPGNETGKVLIYRDELPEGARVEGEGDQGGTAIANMNKAQLITLLEERNVELTGKETKGELLALAAG